MNDVIFGAWVPYVVVFLGVSAAAFVFAVYAAQYDWHLKTNLKGLLWAGAGLVFILMMLLSSQVANIKVLQEKEIETSYGWRALDYAGDRILFQGQSYVDIDKNKISLTKVVNFSLGELRHKVRAKGEDSYGSIIRIYPSMGGLYREDGGNLYFFAIHTYSHREEKMDVCEKVYLGSYKLAGEYGDQFKEIDISECLTDRANLFRIAMRFVDDKLIAILNDSYVLVDTANPEELKLIDKKLDVLTQYRPFAYTDRKEEFDVPLVPIEGISEEERIRLSIDLNFHFYGGDSPIYESSIVDIHDGKIAFAFIERDEVVRYDVARWDDEKIYCKFSASRPYTILENITDRPGFYDPKFVKNGKLYCQGDNALMVFDIRSRGRIRKLGHFVRSDYGIADAAVLEDGNILLCIYRYQDTGENNSTSRRWYLSLLKDPG
jgi:hypothetical protein